jgi:uncharacterized protein
MSKALPEIVKPDALVQAAATLAGTVAVAHMSRLVPMLADTAAQAEVELSFGRNADHFRVIRGHVRAELVLVCQRCVRPMEFLVDSDIMLGLVATEDEAQRLPERYEPLICATPTLDLHTVIEDELLLALPIVPMHPESVCATRAAPGATVTAASRDESDERRRPFAGLAELLRQSRDTRR